MTIFQIRQTSHKKNAPKTERFSVYAVNIIQHFLQEQLQQQYRQPTVQEQLQYQYQQPQDELEEPMTMGEWMITLLIMLIPCANIIMAFVWAFSSTEKKSKSNFFKAYLIFMAIVIVLSILAVIVVGVFTASVVSSSYYYG